MNRFCLIKDICILIFLIVSFGEYSLSQKNDWQPSYTNISANEGLPSSETYYVHQDRMGYMWFCTDHGVVRYDGFRLQVFDKSDGLPDDVIFKIYEDELGRIWFYSYSGGLAYYSQKEHRIIPYRYNNLLAKLNHGDFNTNKDFTVDKKDNVYYSGVYGVGKIDANGKLTHIKNEGYKNLMEINENWFFFGVLDFNFGESRKIMIIPSKGKRRSYTHFEQFYSCDLLEIKNHRFLSASNWVIDLNDTDNKFQFVGLTGMFDIDGELWISTFSGVFRYKNPENLDLRKPDGRYLTNQKVSSVAKDHEGGYWFSTLDDGIYYTSSLDVIHCLPSKEKNQNVIYDINGIGKKVYYASAFGYYDLKSGSQILEKTGGTHRIAVCDNTLMLSNDLRKLKKGPFIKRSWGYEMSEFTGWTNDRKGNLYSVLVSLYKFNKQANKSESLTSIKEAYSSKNYVPHIFKSLVHDDQERIYAGSFVGLFKIDNGKFEKLKLPSEFDRIRITDLAFHKDWGIIVATSGKGLFFLRDEKVVRRIRVNDGLLSDHVSCLHVDQKGAIYVGTNKGVSKIRRSQNKDIDIFNLTKLGGLSSAEVSCIYSNNEGVYIGTRNGITLVPSFYNWNKHSQEGQIHIKTVLANGKLLKNFTDGMKFNASQKVIRFLLRTSNYKSIHERPYKYRFRNSDPWSVGYNGELILINPSFESYELEIQYENELGVWSKPYVLTGFSILPPFYSTWWFTVLVFAITILAAFLFFRRQLFIVQNRNKIQRNMEVLEQKALLAQMNPHFIFNALNSIQSFLLYNENELAERYLLKLSKLIRLTLTNSRETEITIQKEIESLEMYLELEQMRFKNRFEFHLEISLLKEDLTKFVPPMLIQPFAENAIIHGFKGLEQGGKINLHFKRIHHNKLIVEIVDNGVGYSKQRSGMENSGHKSYGTQITSERLSLFKERYQSEFDFSIEGMEDENGNPAGTRVIVSIPVFKKD